MSISLVADLTYAFKQTFSGIDLFVAYLAILAFRVIIPLLAIVKNVCNKVVSPGKKKNPIAIQNAFEPQDAHARNQVEESEQQQFKRNGCLLYTVLPLGYVIGSYRLFSFKNFPLEIGAGLAIDFFCYSLPMIFVQGINSATQESEMSQTTLQTFCFASKFALLAELILEFFIFFYELYVLHNLEKQSINMVVRYSEKERRQMFAAKYACFALVWLLMIAASSAISFFLVAQQNCLENQVLEMYRVCLNCEVDNCQKCQVAGA